MHLGTMERKRLKLVPRPLRPLFRKPAAAPRNPELVRPEVGNVRAEFSIEEDAPAKETEAILFALARAVELRDEATLGHCERLAMISVTLGVAMGLDRTDLTTLYRGGYLHDIGKVGIPD